MNQSDILRACRNRTPDSFAPDGAPLIFVPLSALATLPQVRSRQVRKQVTVMLRKQREA